MIAVLRPTMIMGFFFGVLFSLVAYLADFEAIADFYLVIPFFSALLAGLGGIVATLTTDYLNSRELFQPKTRQALSFTTAALVNTLIVLVIMILFEQVFFQREVIFSVLLGLLIGIGYNIYSYRVDKLKERMEFLEQLADKNRQLQEASRRLAITEERNRLGRELHDSVSQGLHGLVFAIHSLRNDLKNHPPRVGDILDHMEATAKATLDELRTMIEELKPSLLVEQGLVEALIINLNLFSQRQEIPTEVQLALPKNLSADLEMVLYRLCQEGIANIEKHAAAQHVEVKLYYNESNIFFTIKDDGKGFNTKDQYPGNGLHNMYQRVEEVGGTLEIISKPGLGTSLLATFPAKD